MAGISFDVDALPKLPRLYGLALSPSGERLAVSVARPDAKGKRFVSSLYELDAEGMRPPRRLTRSTPGESGAAFAPDGALLFSSSRPDPDAEPEDPRGDRTALWRLPAGGG
jgi:dipeptidyl aminopeptidase/acylaminoacyl peptidase